METDLPDGCPSMVEMENGKDNGKPGIGESDPLRRSMKYAKAESSLGKRASDITQRRYPPLSEARANAVVPPFTGPCLVSGSAPSADSPESPEAPILTGTDGEIEKRAGSSHAAGFSSEAEMFGAR